jgi:thiamine biosynthesis lipoprotein
MNSLREKQVRRNLTQILFLVLLSLIGVGAGMSAPLQRYEFTHPAMGTLFTIIVFADEQSKAEAACHAAFQRVDQLEDVMSDYRADSELMRLCEKPVGQPVPVSADLFEIMQQAQKISELSDGAFDITVGPYVRLWRFARKRKALPTRAELAEASVAVGFRKLRLDPRKRTVTLLMPNMRLDLGGIAKGYAADQALALLKLRGINQALVAASGDIAIGEAPPGKRGWKLGIANLAGANVSSNLFLQNCGISTSGDKEQFIEIGGVRYSHVLDPTTGLGLTNRIQGTAIAPTATMTDSLDNTICVLGPARGLALLDSLPGTAGVLVTWQNGFTHAYLSRRFKQLPATE